MEDRGLPNANPETLLAYWSNSEAEKEFFSINSSYIINSSCLSTSGLLPGGRAGMLLEPCHASELLKLQEDRSDLHIETSGR